MLECDQKQVLDPWFRDRRVLHRHSLAVLAKGTAKSDRVQLIRSFDF